jgi:Ni2+-binding GTPase involved in maturation of urease and hydrogenase
MVIDTEQSDNGLKLIVVAGVASGAGKTSFAEAVIKWLSSRVKTAAAKITVTHGERGCPHGGKGCNTCSSLGGEYQVISKPSVISQEGTDTARLEKAGGVPTIWSITRDDAITKAWREMKKHFTESDCVVVESNTLALVTKPALTLMIVDPTVSRRLWKPSAKGLISEADIVVFNKRGGEEKQKATLEEVLSFRHSMRGILFVEHPSKIVEDEYFIKRLNVV